MRQIVDGETDNEMVNIISLIIIAVALISNSLIKPVHKKHHMVEDDEMIDDEADHKKYDSKTRETSYKNK